MFDDHYLVVEAAQSWVDGADYNNWLPWNQSNPQPGGHSFFYPGLHFLLFWFLQNVLGILEPQTKMYIVRFLHAFYSLLVIYLGYRITERLSNREIAKHVGLLLALLWFFPILSVKNLVELVCIPPLLAVAYNLIKFESSSLKKYLVYAGIFMGISIGIRYQTGFFAMGFGIYLLLRKHLLGAIIFGVTGIGMFVVTQGADVFLWGYPLAEFGEYVRYNIEHRVSYFDRPWYMYLGTLGGILIPPLSLMLFAGYVKGWRKYLILVLPSFLFFAFHSYFPNKQERFVLPFVPFLIMVGLMGWHEIKQGAFWQSRPGLIKGGLTFFWVLNTIALLFLTPAYTKRSQVEVMTWLRQQPDYRNLVVEGSHTDTPAKPPLFYLGNWQPYFFTSKSSYTAKIVRKHNDFFGEDATPNYVVFMDEADFDARKQRFEEGYRCDLELMATIEPSYIDALLHTLNPNNENYTARIYKIHERE